LTALHITVLSIQVFYLVYFNSVLPQSTEHKYDKLPETYERHGMEPVIENIVWSCTHCAKLQNATGTEFPLPSAAILNAKRAWFCCYDLSSIAVFVHAFTSRRHYLLCIAFARSIYHSSILENCPKYMSTNQRLRIRFLSTDESIKSSFLPFSSCVIDLFYILFWVVCTNVDQNLIADQRHFRAKYLQNGEEN